MDVLDRVVLEMSKYYGLEGVRRYLRHTFVESIVIASVCGVSNVYVWRKKVLQRWEGG